MVTVRMVEDRGLLLRKGDVVELADEESAQALVDGGWAERVTDE